MSNVFASQQQGPIPPEIDRWNWGAFLLSWIWGIGNNVLAALLALIPVLGIIMIFVLGARGSRWAWRHKRWESVEHFRRVQRKWAIAGVIVWLVLIGVVAGGYFAVSAIFKGSDVYQQAVARVTANAEATRVLGPPLEFGFPMGAVSISEGLGEAHLWIPVQGAKAAGTVYLDATKRMGVWEFNRFELAVDGREDHIDLGGKSAPGQMI